MVTDPISSHSNSRKWQYLVPVVTLVCLSIVASQIDVRALAKSLANIPWEALAGAGALMLLGALLAALRLRFIAADIGTSLSARDTLLALSVGQIVGVATVQFFGQIAARSALLGHRGVSAPANIAIALVERLVALTISLALAVSGAGYLFGTVSIGKSVEGALFIYLLVSLLLAVCSSALFGWGPAAIKLLGGGIGRRAFVSLSRTAVLTLMIQLATLSAYLLIAVPLAKTLPLPQLIAAALVVMFAASLPISFAGWGVRELSAVIALSAIGMSNADALAVAIAIGVLAIVAVVVIAALAVLLPPGRASVAASKRPSTSINIEDFVMLVLPAAAATAVFFQIHIPIGDSTVNVNLADPVAILGAFVFIVYYTVRRQETWRLEGLRWYILALTSVLCGAFLIGYLRYGWIDWAFTNKLMGWLVLLAYGATGALIVHRFSAEGATVIANSYGAAGASVVVGAVIMIAITKAGIAIPTAVFVIPIEGFSQNRNAFAFTLLMGVCLGPLMSHRLRPWLIGILATGIVLTNSLSGIAALAIVFAAAWFSGTFSWRELANAVGVCIGVVTLIDSVPYIVVASIYILNTLDSVSSPATVSNAAPFDWIRINPKGFEGSNTERMKTLFDGLALFEKHPGFGAGLGAYIASQTGNAAVIHSTPIWLLAETGIVGFAVFFAFAAHILIQECRHFRSDRASTAVVLAAISFIIMSLVHELMYQRAFWLVLGVALSMPKYRRR